MPADTVGPPKTGANLVVTPIRRKRAIADADGRLCYRFGARPAADPEAMESL